MVGRHKWKNLLLKVMARVIEVTEDSDGRIKAEGEIPLPHIVEQVGPFNALCIGSMQTPIPVPKLPHQVFAELANLQSLFSGGQTAPIFGPTTVAEQYNPFQTAGRIPGVTLGFGKFPQTYPSTPEASTVELRVKNNSDQMKMLNIQMFQRFCRFQAQHRCEWDPSPIAAGPPTQISLRPGGIFDAEMAMYTPPHPASPPNMGDIVRVDLLFVVTDEQGNQAVVKRQMRPSGTKFP